MTAVDEAYYVLGVQPGAMSLAQLKKRLMVLDTVMVLSMAGDCAYRYGCEELAMPTGFSLLSSGRSIGKAGTAYFSSSPLLLAAICKVTVQSVLENRSL